MSLATYSASRPFDLPKPDRLTRMGLRLLEGLEVGYLRVRLPGGRTVAFGGRRPGPDATLVIHDSAAIRRILAGGDIGFAEAYMDGLVDSPDLATLVELFARNNTASDHGQRHRFVRALARRVQHWLNRNSRSGSRRNIGYHYDLGNSFYETWLDPTMTYSAGRYEAGNLDLVEAQHAKYRRIAERLRLKPGNRVLEIGCGWGGFAEYAARAYDVQVHGITLSQAQHAYAVGRIRRAGLEDRVTISLTDYRDVEGTYDAIASIEMFEAVGQAYWPGFFDTLRQRLAPAGRAALQIITIAEESFEDYRRNPDFIQRYIFPGGMLPTRRHLLDLADGAGMAVRDEEAFGADYARTLADWRDRFERRIADIAGLGYDKRFLRMWRYYLSYCEGGFRSGNIDVRQIALERS